MLIEVATRGILKMYQQKKWDEMGYNESHIHTDIVSTTDRTVTATLEDGSELVIYENGMFTLDLE